jgi:starvation-inducible DNA-binding protein
MDLTPEGQEMHHPDTVEDLAEHLMVCLANATVMYHRAHGFHWNVTGPDFPQWHDKFAEIYEDIYSSLDPLAENIRKLRKVAPFCLSDLSEKCTIGDSEVANFDARTLAQDLFRSNVAMIACLNDAFMAATHVNQQGIANFIAERLDAHQKWDWQLLASLK